MTLLIVALLASNVSSSPRDVSVLLESIQKPKDHKLVARFSRRAPKPNQLEFDLMYNALQIDVDGRPLIAHGLSMKFVITSGGNILALERGRFNMNNGVEKKISFGAEGATWIYEWSGGQTKGIVSTTAGSRSAEWLLWFWKTKPIIGAKCTFGAIENLSQNPKLITLTAQYVRDETITVGKKKMKTHVVDAGEMIVWIDDIGAWRKLEVRFRNSEKSPWAPAIPFVESAPN